MNYLIRLFKLFIYSKKGTRNLSIFTIIISIIIFYLIKNDLKIEEINSIVSSDMFNIAGVLSGFIFTGLGMIITSNSKMIEEVRETQNFCVIKKYYTITIMYFLLVIIMYLFQKFILFSNVYSLLKILYSYYIIVFFIMGIIFFIVSLRILIAVIDD